MRVRLAVLVLLALLPALGLIFYAAREDRRLATAQAEQDALRIVRLAALQHSHLVEAAHHLLVGLTHLPAVRRLDAGACAKTFVGMLGQFPSYSNIVAAKPNGDIFCSAVPLPGPINLADREHFQRVLQTRDFVASKYVVARTTGKPTIIFLYPLVDESGVVRVVVAVVLDLHWLHRLAEQALLPPASTLSVVDQDGVVLARYPDSRGWVGRVVPEATIVRAVLSRQAEGTAEAPGLDGIRRLYAFTRLPTRAESGEVYIGIGTPTAVVFAEADRARTRNLRGLGLVGALALGATWIAGNLLILRRVHPIVRATQRLGAGDLGARTGLQSRAGSDELSQLARAFDDMAAALEQRTAEGKRADDALRASEDRFRSVAQSAADAIIVARADGTVLFSNRATQAMFGYGEDDLLGRPLALLMPERHREAHQAGLERLGATGESRLLGKVVELHGRRRDGTEFPLELALAGWETGGQRFLSGVIRDVTERQRAERFQAMGLAVAGVLAEVTTLDEATPRVLEEVCLGADWDLVEMWVADGDELRWQGSWHRPELEASPFLAASREMPVGRSGGLAGKAWREGQPVWDEDVLANPGFMRAEAAAVAGLHGALACPLRGKAPVGVLACFSRAPRPRDDRLLAVMQDVTQRVGHFVERQRAAEVLRQSEAQVRQLQRLESVGRLAGGVAHDFNNLLTVILGRSQLLLARSQIDDRARQDVTLIQQTGERASALTRQLLAFSRKQVLEPKVLDLSALVSGLAVMLRRLIGEDIDLAVRPGPDLGHVNADPGQVEQVIVNLVVNARDAMPQGGHLTLETANIELDARYARQHPGAHPGSYVMLAVSDTGIGMDAEIQARVFEPFFTTKEPGKGTGLGLSTVYGIVKQSDGYISLSSAPGRGTTLKIYLPRVEAPVATEGQVVSTPAGGSETILVVEDEDEVRALALEVLEQSGYTVLAASGPAEALGIAERHDGPIHLILTDVVMPHMSGPQLAKDIAPLRPGIKVLYMSGYTADAVAQHGILDPGLSLLQKPFLLHALARKVREVLDTPP
ncbi:MAG: PAS domain S-box protein [Candidatus Rokubacteria bacterium]|nr:PAS domain S-box protein [Candidatus Rokubacteria bacterium]